LSQKRAPIRGACHLAALSAAVLALSATFARADTTILADTYRDKLHGMWLGQLMGNYAGRPREGYIQRGGLNYTVDWNAATGGQTWDGDDDTCFELLYADVLNSSSDPNPAQIGQEWLDHLYPNSFYIANRQARQLMNQGFTPPQTGSSQYNMHWYAIDSQITTESLGAMSPGMRQRAAELTGRFASASNSGYPVHAAQFYAAMYAASAFEPNVEQLISKGLEVVPATSRTYQVIDDVVRWYQQDKLDDVLDWRATQTKVYDKYYGSACMGRAYNWVESTVNAGMTTLALLYGQGDYKNTVEIGVCAGFDSDCNPATAGGLVGMIYGYSGLPADLTAACASDYQADAWLRNMPLNRTVSQIVNGLQTAAEGQLLLGGGSISGSGAARTYHLGDDLIQPPPEKPDPAGPKGLVGTVKAMGGTVTVSASVEVHNPNWDQHNLDAIIDGITDVSYDGHRAYSTYDGTNAQPSGGDFYQIDFGRKVRMRKLVFYEGEYAWGGVNTYPPVDSAVGGFFTDLVVEIGHQGSFTPVGNLQLSEPLDRCKFYQIIELTFDPADGDAVRIRGTAGGSAEFTTILELEAYGAVFQPGDATLDGNVNSADLSDLVGNWKKTGMDWTQGDFGGDGVINSADLSDLVAYWGWSAPNLPAAGPEQPLPEPATVFLSIGGLLLLSRRRLTARRRSVH
jgi:hypothetical protein